MSFLMLSIHRPVAVAMFFIGIILLGGIAWQKIPVELFPRLVGSEININFYRPGSNPEVIEREILLPLQAQISTMSDIAETRGQIRGSNGQFTVRFEPKIDIKIREFELQRIITELQRNQPQGTSLTVSSAGTQAISELAMVLYIVGKNNDGKNALYDITDQMIAPRFASMSGVSQAMAVGGSKPQVTVTVDPIRTTALGVTVDSVVTMVRNTLGRAQYTGSMNSERGQTSVVLDGRPMGLHSLSNSRIEYNKPALLHHTSEVTLGPGPESGLFRVNGQASVGLVIYQDQDSNLIRLGKNLRSRIAEVKEELNPQGLDLVVGFDAAETIETQIEYLSKLGASGFLVALAILFLFLRQWRAVAVVGLAVPVSLMAALAFLYLLDQTLNLVSLFGLMLAIGLVVDNSVVVFEAIQRHLERGQDIETAVNKGLRRTVRAILAASTTTAIVFLPIILVDIEDPMILQSVIILSLSILLPLAGSLIVAIGLVPLLAHYLAAPAAAQRISIAKARRREKGNLVPPDQAKILFSIIVAKALRYPSTWIIGTLAAILLTGAIALPWVSSIGNLDQASEPDTIQLTARFPSNRSLEVASNAVAILENVLLEDPFVESVESQIDENGGSLTIRLVDRDERPEDFRAQSVRNKIYEAARNVKGGFRILRPGDETASGGGKSAGDAFGGTPTEIVLSGPDSEVLLSLADSVESQLESTPQISAAWTNVQPGMSEFWIEPIGPVFESLGLTFSQVLPVLQLAGREGQRMPIGFITDNGRELPVFVTRKGAREKNSGMRDLTRMRIQTPAGVMPVTALATMRQMPPPTVISHRNGRREVSVMYRLRDDIPDTGPTRLSIEREISELVRAIPKPSGVSIETTDNNDTEVWFKKISVPAVALLFLVLATVFESLTLPLLILLALPLTILGAIWALAFAGIAFELMAAMGAIVLVGLTVNPAILLVDRIQQLIRESHWSSGAAAFAAVKERTRPVLMTSATTIAGLWPLTIVTGRENEIWPPFAIVVIGGLVTSSLLTLVLIPVGFTLLNKVDNFFIRAGPWLVLFWISSMLITMMMLVWTETLTALPWQIISALLIGSVYLALIMLIFRPKEVPVLDLVNGCPKLTVTHLHKKYGISGPLKTALLAPEIYAENVISRGGKVFLPSDARDRFAPLVLGIFGLGIVAIMVQSAFWELFFWMMTGFLLTRLITEIQKFRGHVTQKGKALHSRIVERLIYAAPWLVIISYLLFTEINLHTQGSEKPNAYFVSAIAALIVLIAQGMRHSAERQSRGLLPRRVSHSRIKAVINSWRGLSAQVAGLDLPDDPIVALSGVNFEIERGMVGILGPNGAGKTTLLRQLAGILNPTRGTIRYGGVQLKRIQRYLANWVGYLPQDTGLPAGMSAVDYLNWYAALYGIPAGERKQRVKDLLGEVDLTGKKDEKISELSGGMQQRVAIARTLLRMPPVIIVDEPTVGLDPRERIRLRNLLSKLARDRIVLISTHVVEDVAAACERVIVIAKGELVFDGGTEELAHRATAKVWEVRTQQGIKPIIPTKSIRTHET
ncbi:MAG: ATP-binding cassette domain-containing protein, partial [OM182 bacterium]